MIQIKHVIALLLIPILLTGSAETAKTNCWSSKHIAGSVFGLQALAEKALSSVSSQHLSIARILGIPTAKSLRTLLKPKDIAKSIGFLSPFFAGIWIVFYFFNDTVETSAISAHASFAILAISTATSGSLIAQWRRIHRGLQDQIEVWPVIYLILLGLIHSSLVEYWAWGKLEAIHLVSVPWLNAFLQAVIDYFGLSLIFATVWAMFFYGRNFDPRNEAEALHEIHTSFLGFYYRHEWKWAIWILLSMLTEKIPLLSFTFFQAGVLQWNVLFDYGDYPRSWDLIYELRKNPRAQWLSSLMAIMQKGLEHPLYIHFLKNTLMMAYIFSIGQLLSEISVTRSFASGAMQIAVWGWIAWLLKTNVRPWPWRRMARLTAYWVWLLSVTPLSASYNKRASPPSRSWNSSLHHAV